MGWCAWARRRWGGDQKSTRAFLHAVFGTEVSQSDELLCAVERWTKLVRERGAAAAPELLCDVHVCVSSREVTRHRVVPGHVRREQPGLCHPHSGGVARDADGGGGVRGAYFVAVRGAVRGVDLAEYLETLIR